MADGKPTRADASHALDYAPDETLEDGARVAGRGFTLEAVATPGHAANHLSFALAEENALFSGDHVMAWSTSVVAPPDGSMRAYLASLEKVARRSEAIYWPGHGGPVREPQRYVRALISHRRQREAAILARLEAGEANVAEIVARVYPEPRAGAGRRGEPVDARPSRGPDRARPGDERRRNHARSAVSPPLTPAHGSCSASCTAAAKRAK